jgi:hypothetical protein
VLVFCAALSNGCSMLIAQSGKDLNICATREEVRAELGEPCASGVEEGKRFEEYRSRWKISEAGSYGCLTYGMGFAMTFGASELLLFPQALYLLGKRTVLGQTVRVTYDDAGIVTGLYLDGEDLDCPLTAAGQRAHDHRAAAARGRNSAPASADIPTSTPAPAAPSSP